MSGSTLFRVARAFDGGVEHVARADAPLQPLAGSRYVALTQHIDAAQFERVNIKRRSDLFHLHLVSESDLRRAETAKRAVGRRVRRDGARRDADVVATVRAERVNRAARQHYR